MDYRKVIYESQINLDPSSNLIKFTRVRIVSTDSSKFSTTEYIMECYLGLDALGNEQWRRLNPTSEGQVLLHLGREHIEHLRKETFGEPLDAQLCQSIGGFF